MLKIIFNLFIISTLFTFKVSADDGLEELLSLYEKKEFTNLKSAVDKLQPQKNNSVDFLFYKTLFTEDGEAAFKDYQTVFKNGSKIYRSLAAQKLMEYYYAKGYYMNASKYQKYQVENPYNQEYIQTKNKQADKNSTVSQNDSKLYQIQIGAFGVKDNALQLQRMLETQDVKAKMVIRIVNNKELYCIWIAGTDDFENTLKYANKLRSKYNLQYRIIKE